MTTFVRSPEAARRLGVTLNTLYAYVSRGRVHRTLAADGRTSLFDLDEIDALRARSHRASSEPPPSIDVRIATGITRLDEDGPSYRDLRVETLLVQPFEAIAELLWSGSLPDPAPAWQLAMPTSPSQPTRPDVTAIIRLALDLGGPTEDTAAARIDVGRRLLCAIPAHFGATPRPGDSFAHAVARIWFPTPSEPLVAAIDRVLLLLADHELATSTLAVRVATSTRASTTMCLIAGLAAVDGDLHGAAARHAHELIDAAAAHGARKAIMSALADSGRVPGFGHSIYRVQDPRFSMLLDRVRALPDPGNRMQVVDDLLAEAGTTVPRAPNIDLALGAFTWITGLPSDTPLFSIARIAGWTAHHLEELGERPLRFRGLAR